MHVSVGYLVVKEVAVRFTVHMEGALNGEQVDMCCRGGEVLKYSAPPVVIAMTAFKFRVSIRMTVALKSHFRSLLICRVTSYH